jgi:hypothetical protein
MPILPYIGDDESHLSDAIQATRDHGGTFVLGGGMSMEGAQAERTLAAAERLEPELASKWRKFYGWTEARKPSYSPPAVYRARLGRRVRELCERYGVADRMRRYIPPGPLAINKRIAEQFYLKSYELEMQEANSYRIWAYRKAAWKLDDLQEGVATLYETRGTEGVRESVGVGRGLAEEIVQILLTQGNPAQEVNYASG